MKTLKNYLVAGLIGFGSFNFSLGQSNPNKLQSYENIRYSDSLIPYKIEPCLPQNKAKIEKVLSLLEEKTILDFYEVNANEKLFFTFENIDIKEGKYSVEGFGGPQNMLKSGQFYVIGKGVVILKKSDNCFGDILHETLHALGFAHSSNPKDILFPSTGLINRECNTDFNVNENIYKLINKLYATPNQADLVISKIIPKRAENNCLNLDVTIMNCGLKKSEKSTLNFYLNNKIIRTINIEELGAGSINIMKFNTELKKNTPGKLKMIIENNFEELDKKNNEKIFDISQIK